MENVGSAVCGGHRALGTRQNNEQFEEKICIVKYVASTLNPLTPDTQGYNVKTKKGFDWGKRVVVRVLLMNKLFNGIYASTKNRSLSVEHKSDYNIFKAIDIVLNV